MALQDLTARHLVALIRSLGYHVSVFRLGPSMLGEPGRIEMHAVRDEEETIIAWAEDHLEDGDYLVACEVAAQVGIDLEG